MNNRFTVTPLQTFGRHALSDADVAFPFSHDEVPRLSEMGIQHFVVDLIQLDSDPSAAADIRRPVVHLRSLFDQRFLQARWRG